MSEHSTPAPAAGQCHVEYRPVVGFPDYLVGDDGSVWSQKTARGHPSTRRSRKVPWHRLQGSRDRKGYWRVGLTRGDRHYLRWLHRLVLEAFVGPRPPGMEGCHYPDTDKGNNRVGNLRWDTPAGNSRDKYRDRIAPDGMRCVDCDRVKPASEFYTADTSSGLKARCKACFLDKYRDRTRERMRRRRATARAVAEGIPIEQVRPKRRVWTAEEIATVLRLRRKLRLPFREIGRRVGRSWGSVKDVVRRTPEEA